MKYVVCGFDGVSWDYVGKGNTKAEVDEVIKRDWNAISHSYKEGYIVPASLTYMHEESKRLNETDEEKDDELMERFCYQVLDLNMIDNYLN